MDHTLALPNFDLDKQRLIKNACEGNSVFEPLEYDIDMRLTATAEREMEHLDIQLDFTRKLTCCIFEDEKPCGSQIEIVKHAYFFSRPSLKSLQMRFILMNIDFYVNLMVVQFVRTLKKRM